MFSEFRSTQPGRRAASKETGAARRALDVTVVMRAGWWQPVVREKFITFPQSLNDKLQFE